MTDIPRRRFVAAAGGALAAAWVFADVEQLRATAEHVAALGRLQRLEVLTPAQAAALDAATSQILPSDDTAGAREARVVNFIDRALATWQKEQRPTFEAGVRELDARAAKQVPGARSFAALADAQQHAVIASLETDRHEFFNVLRGATITGMLANPEYGGNFGKQGWQMLGFVDQFSWTAPFGYYDR